MSASGEESPLEWSSTQNQQAGDLSAASVTEWEEQGGPWLLRLTRQPIDAAELLERVRSSECGAVVLFLGTVREFTAEKQTKSLEYEAYPEMALRELRRIVEESCSAWPIRHVGIVHRLGPLELGEVAIGLAVSAPHREAAFTAAETMMTRIKQTVPIWKKEHWSDGDSAWIHPGGG